MARSNVFFVSVAGAIVLLLLMLSYSSVKVREEAGALERKSSMVRAFDLTDLCLFGDARYTRHLSQTDLHAPFQDGPMSFEHFPSGSLVGPPAHAAVRE